MVPKTQTATPAKSSSGLGRICINVAIVLAALSIYVYQYVFFFVHDRLAQGTTVQFEQQRTFDYIIVGAGTYVKK